MPFPTPEYLPSSRIELRSSALQADSLLSEPPGKHLPDHRRTVKHKNLNLGSGLLADLNFFNFNQRRIEIVGQALVLSLYP